MEKIEIFPIGSKVKVDGLDCTIRSISYPPLEYQVAYWQSDGRCYLTVRPYEIVTSVKKQKI